MSLQDELTALYAGDGDIGALTGEFRRSSVLVPLLGDEQMLAAVRAGIQWIFAFSGEDALSRFAEARGAVPGDEWRYLRLMGARLLDVVVPEVDGIVGVALDAGSEQGFLFPPAPGIVPESSVLDPGAAVEASVPSAVPPPHTSAYAGRS